MIEFIGAITEEDLTKADKDTIAMIKSQALVRCRDCKHHSFDAGYGYDWCNRTSGIFRVKPDDFCSRAERRTDEPDK